VSAENRDGSRGSEVAKRLAGSAANRIYDERANIGQLGMGVKGEVKTRVRWCEGMSERVHECTKLRGNGDGATLLRIKLRSAGWETRGLGDKGTERLEKLSVRVSDGASERMGETREIMEMGGQGDNETARQK
jgi:hypothetical protein